jgi:hypothetical protein
MAALWRGGFRAVTLVGKDLRVDLDRAEASS